MKKLLFPLIALVLGCGAMAQSLGEIQGTVLDEAQQPLPFANVVTTYGDQLIGATTDERGRFVLKPLNPGTYTVRISYVGLLPKEITGVLVNPDKITRLMGEVLVANNTLPEFSVEARRWEPPLIDPEEPSKLTVIAAQFESNPLRKSPVSMIASLSPDIYKAPGSNELYFRGSRSDAMAYFVDGVKVSGSLTGVPSDGIASITMYTGGLPARYGDVTGGVVAIETKSYLDLYMQRQAGLR
ncbi:MAG TPA: TonB-dependent receptor [Flavobacteriales bacterium]|nr:TonB-dependent receptor [Flavobacteriales bacterium]